MDTFLRPEPVAMMEQQAAPISSQKSFPTRSLQKPDLKVVFAKLWVFEKDLWGVRGSWAWNVDFSRHLRFFSKSRCGWKFECAGSTEFLTSCYFKVLFHLSTFNVWASVVRWEKDCGFQVGRRVHRKQWWWPNRDKLWPPSKQRGWKPDWSVFALKLVRRIITFHILLPTLMMRAAARDKL